MILLVFKLALTAFIIMFLGMLVDKFLEPENKWEKQEPKILKVREIAMIVTVYSFLAGLALGVIWVMMLIWGI